MSKNAAFFEELENTRPFLKAAFEGFAGSGKSHTAGLVAVGLHDMIKSDKPIACYYTERAGKGALNKFYRERNKKVLIRESRTLADLETTIMLCEQGAADILLIDSITHVWQEFLRQYQQQKNRNKLYFSDWGVIKPRWREQFTDKFLSAKVHIIFTGRAAWEYEETIDENNRKELSKSGIKMKSESETEYEPDLVVLMRQEKYVSGNAQTIKRHCTIMKDRTNLIDGQDFCEPNYEVFQPVVVELINGTPRESLTDGTPDEFPAEGGSDPAKRREMIKDEIKGHFDFMGLGQSKEDKQFKATVCDVLFGVKSWSALDTKDLAILERGLSLLGEFTGTFVDYAQAAKDEGVSLDYGKMKALLEEINVGTSEVEKIANGVPPQN